MERRTMKVSELNMLVRLMFEAEPILQDAWVEGEISNLRRQSSGHLYFSLKDDQSQIRCVMFASKARMLRFRPENEQKVLLGGSVSLYERDGTYQIVASQMEPLGIGALAQALEQLKAKLTAEGLFEAERKRPLPFCPRVIGIVTSPSGAALRDMLQVLRRRNPRLRIVLAPSLVQGEGAAEEIAAGIELLNRLDGVEVIIVGRGGGSLEDLWCFNEEVVVRAIAASRLPVISAVGHETDTTLADYAADLRAPTPSAAAELAVPEIGLLLDDLNDLRQRMEQAVEIRIRHEQEDLAVLQGRFSPERLMHWSQQRRDRIAEFNLRLQTGAERRLSQEKQQVQRFQDRFATPQSLRNWLEHRQQRLVEQTHSLGNMVEHRLEMMRRHLEGSAHKLQLLSPLNTLTRGYTVLRRRDGRLVASVKELKAGDDVQFELADGQAEARVLQVVFEERMVRSEREGKRNG